jgi:Fe-S-cluster containining protein
MADLSSLASFLSLTLRHCVSCCCFFFIESRFVDEDESAARPVQDAVEDEEEVEAEAAEAVAVAVAVAVAAEAAVEAAEIVVVVALFM